MSQKNRGAKTYWCPKGCGKTVTYRNKTKGYVCGVCCNNWLMTNKDFKYFLRSGEGE